MSVFMTSYGCAARGRVCMRGRTLCVLMQILRVRVCSIRTSFHIFIHACVRVCVGGCLSACVLLISRSMWASACVSECVHVYVCVCIYVCISDRVGDVWRGCCACVRVQVRREHAFMCVELLVYVWMRVDCVCVPGFVNGRGCGNACVCRVGTWVCLRKMSFPRMYAWLSAHMCTCVCACICEQFMHQITPSSMFVSECISLGVCVYLSMCACVFEYVSVSECVRLFLFL